MFEINHIIGYFRRKPGNVMEGSRNEISPVLQTDPLWASLSLFRVAVSIPTYCSSLHPCCSPLITSPFVLWLPVSCFPAILISFFLSYLPPPVTCSSSLCELNSRLSLSWLYLAVPVTESILLCPLTFLHFLSSLGNHVSDCFKSAKCGPS